jgi:uncharacterized lipoprotein YajG
MNMTKTKKNVRIALLALTASLALLTGAEAKNRSRPFDIALRFVPGEDSIASSTPEQLPSGVTDRPVRLLLTDDRSDPADIGESSDDDDKLWPVHATNDVTAWAHGALQKTLTAWDIKLADNAPLILAVKLTALKLEESNKAVGSTFHAEVKLAASLKNAKGAVLWDGTAFGDATRYGKSRSEENANEVFSDALIEAAADLLGNEDLQEAWAGNGTPRAAASSAPAPSSADATRITPSALLAELVKLKKQGFDTDLLVDYVNKKTLTNELSSDDLVKWKQAGMPEEVIKAALAR